MIFLLFLVLYVYLYFARPAIFSDILLSDTFAGPRCSQANSPYLKQIILLTFHHGTLVVVQIIQISGMV